MPYLSPPYRLLLIILWIFMNIIPSLWEML
jgi:hypothetical protein